MDDVAGREAVLEAIRTVSAVAADLTVLSGETHHAACFRLQIEDTVVNGVDYILLDADAKIAGDHLVAPAAVRRPDAEAPCWSPRHESLGASHGQGLAVANRPTA